jgi:peptidoglycan/xylan/chitin deacetylase (PgdA/CDA1 family)
MKLWQDKRIAILCYHRVVPAPFNTKHGICVEVQNFKRQMKLIASKGYRTISIDMLTDSLKEETQLPQKSIIITFDDGYQDNYLYAFPILKEYNFTATIYLVSGHIGDTNQWDSCPQEEGIKLLSIAEIKEMADYGISFGAHTVTHPHLTRLSEDKAFYEIAQSKKDIEGIIGQKVTSFCYPYGEFSQQTKQMVIESGFKCACACDTEHVHDLYELCRRQIFPDTGLFGFSRKIQKWYPEYTKMRKRCKNMLRLRG